MKNYKKIVIPVIAIGAVGAVAIGSEVLQKESKKDVKVEEITDNAIDSTNSVICSALKDYNDSIEAWKKQKAAEVAQNSGSLTTKKGAKLTKEQFSEETGLQGEDLDFYYDFYSQCISGGDSEEVAYKSVLDEMAIDAEIASTDTDNSNSGNTGNTSRPSTSSSSGNSNGGSSSSNIENGTQNQNGEQVRSDEEAQAMLRSINGADYDWVMDGVQSDPLTDEERAAEEAAMEGLHGF